MPVPFIVNPAAHCHAIANVSPDQPNWKIPKIWKMKGDEVEICRADTITSLMETLILSQNLHSLV